MSKLKWVKKMTGKKIGMTQVFDSAGKLLGVTVVEISSGEDFKPGERVNVSGLTIGKGFAGNVKRFHTRRGPMSHGSKSHRLPGSSGSGTTPGRVWRGRKMPGRLGGGRATSKNLTVVQMMPERNLLLLLGSVPGKRGNQVLIKKV